MSAVSYVAGLWERCVAAARSVAGGEREAGSRSGSATVVSPHGHGGDRAAGDATLFLYGQALWMAVTLAVLYALSLLSGRLYFLVSFIGLLCNRVLFAPRATTSRWWRVANAVTWLCFAGLAYVVYLRVTAAAAGSA